MQLIEVVVNIPIRRTYARHEHPPHDVADEPGAEEQPAPAQTFHYHLPPALEGRVEPGHLVWVPFGHQQVQGVVVGFAAGSPVPTRPVARLARPEPVLQPWQVELAMWMAQAYVAPLAETIKLFIPPGMLTKDGRAPAARAKYEWLVEALVPPDAVESRLRTAGRDNAQACVLARLLHQPAARPTRAELRAACSLKSDSTFQTLAGKSLVDLTGDEVALAVSPEEAHGALLAARGSDKYAPIMAALHAADRPMWKSTLAAETGADLALLRAMQADGLIGLREQIRFRDPLAGQEYAHTRAPALTSEQQRVWDTLRAHAFDDGVTHSKFLLHGVTGSGKTEIYLRAIDAALAQKRQALVLVPEIALTPQTVARFAGRFPGRVTVIHSELSTGERYDVWRLVRRGEFDIVVGPRSALFAPLARLGLIIIDEEHESSYKQHAEEWGSFTVFYDARAVATQLAAITQSALIMGSATPSMESYYAMQQGRLTLLEMPNRVLGHREHLPQAHVGAASATSVNVPPGQFDDAEPTVYAELPPVEIVDMRQELRAGNRSIFSRSLSAELQATLSAGEQAILFLNRRGTATFIMCRDCGAVSECPLCATPLTYHERAQMLICHHCNRRYPIPQTCPECGSKRIKYFGSGTQRVEEYVHQIVPQARVVRWDADSVARKGQHAAILREFVEQRADVMVGTQMIAKGLDLPMVTLVGVVAADVGLYLPDFRSSERTFQLLTQVAGRAGRSARGGRVVVQTYTPEHYAIQAAAQHDYAAFYARELLFREEHGYPPVQRMARLIFWHKNEAKAQAESERMVLDLRRRAEGLPFRGDLDILGPAPAFFSRYRGYYRWQILLRAENPGALLAGLDIPFGWRIDIDPVSVL